MIYICKLHWNLKELEAKAFSLFDRKTSGVSPERITSIESSEVLASLEQKQQEEEEEEETAVRSFRTLSAREVEVEVLMIYV